MTIPRREPAEPQAAPPRSSQPRAEERDLAELREPYDLPVPEDQWPPERPAYLIVVDQLRGWQPGQPPSLAELLETRPARTREPEPDLAAEP